MICTVNLIFPFFFSVMFLCKNIIYRTSQYGLIKRFGSSSCNNNKNDVKENNKQEKTTTKKEIVEKVQFMPVINIPENELAYNAFFSLHRPLLGLSSKTKRSFFSSKCIEEEQEAESDEALFQYMSTLEHFVEPSTPGTQMSKVQQDQKHKLLNKLNLNQH
ncbi:unnamed protein product [Rhizopus stolonifer]